MCENKSGKFIPQNFTTVFGENFPAKIFSCTVHVHVHVHSIHYIPTHSALGNAQSRSLPHLCLGEGAPERIHLLLQGPLSPADLPQPLALGDGRVGGLTQLGLQDTLLLTRLCYSLGRVGRKGEGREREGGGGGGDKEGCFSVGSCISSLNTNFDWKETLLTFRLDALNTLFL